MRLLDRFLFTVSAISLVGIVLILSTEDVVAGESPRLSNTAPEKPTEPVSELPVLSREIDAVIENYFATIREHPEIETEESRLLEEKLEAGEISVEKKASEEFTLRHYTVQKGDSLWKIAQDFSVPVYTILSANPEYKNKVLSPGVKLQIPDRSGVLYKVKRGDTLSAIARLYKLSESEIQKANSLNSNIIQAGAILFLPGAREAIAVVEYVTRKMFLMPVKGRCTSGYGFRQHPVHGSRLFHSGLDIGARHGAPISAAADGVVIYAGFSSSYGNMVVLKHRNNYITVYAHASKLFVSKGEKVKKGQKIAAVGATGVATGPHLHFEVKKNGKTIDPSKALQLTEKVKKG